MTDFYKNTRSCIDRFNELCDKVYYSAHELTDEEDEFFDNFCIYLAHALIKDTGTEQRPRKELCRMADIINSAIE